jgi:hypothetical protein
MMSRELMEDYRIKTMYEIKWVSNGGIPAIHYYSADELTLIGSWEEVPQEFEVRTLTYKEYLDRIYGT